MTPRERQRAATLAVWRQDADARPDGAWTDLGGVQLHTTALPVGHWNGAHLHSPDGLAQLPEAASWFAARGMPWGLLVPAELDLEPPGGTWVTDQPVMLRDLSDLPSPGSLPLRWDDPDGCAVVQAAAFEDPLDLTRRFVLPKTTSAACRLLTAYDGGRPVATATAVHVDGVAGIYGVATLPSHRRRGLGAAVTLAVLHDAAAHGCDLAFLNPSPMAHGVYARLGFVNDLPWQVWSVADPLPEGDVQP